MSDSKVEYTFLWFIENYSHSFQENGERLLSPCFTADELEGTSWRINVYPRGRTEEDKGYISLYLGRNVVDDGPETVSLNYELSILAADGSPVFPNVSKHTFSKNNAKGWPQFVNIKEIFQDTLIVRCRIWKGEGKVHQLSPICARTHIAVQNISFLHAVENFSALEANQKKTIKIRLQPRSSSFISSSLYFTNDPCCEGGMFLEITPSDSEHNLSKRKIYLLDATGSLIACDDNDNRFDDTRTDFRKLPLSLTRQDILNKKSEYLPDDKLSLICECSYPTGREVEKSEGTNGEIPRFHPRPRRGRGCASRTRIYHQKKVVCSAYPNASEGMEALYISLTNVELKTKTKSFPAHKSVLCARSPVFKAMITNDVAGKNTDYIQIDDLEDDIVKQLLIFLYSDRIENLQWDNATQLYCAGNNYQIGKLKEDCSSFMVEHLTTTNAGELLVLADTHDDTDLKKSVEDFILEFEEQVFGTEEWDVLIQTNPELAAKTMKLKYRRN